MTDKPDTIHRADAIDLCKSSGFLSVEELRALPAAQVVVKPGEIERAIWSAMIWAAGNNPAFNDLPEYTDRGNSFAEDECRRASARIRSVLIDTPPATRKEVMPDDAAEIDGLPRSLDASPGVTAGAATPPAVSDDVAALVGQLNRAVYTEAKRQWAESEKTVGEYDDAPEVMRKLCEQVVLREALARLGGVK